jgi:hypothetical protein
MACRIASLAIAATVSPTLETTPMNKPLPRIFRYIGLAVIGLTLAFYATAVATGGIAAGIAGRASGGEELLSAGSAALLVGVAMFAVFSYLALKDGWSELKQRR